MLLIKLNHTLLCSGSKVIPEIREQVRRLEARYIAIKQIQDLKDQIEELKKERIWAEVIENEKVKYIYDVTAKKKLVIYPMPAKQAGNDSCPVDQVFELYMPRFENRTFHGVDNYAYLRHAKLEDHNSVQQNLTIITCISLHCDTTINRTT